MRLRSSHIPVASLQGCAQQCLADAGDHARQARERFRLGRGFLLGQVFNHHALAARVGVARLAAREKRWRVAHRAGQKKRTGGTLGRRLV